MRKWLFVVAAIVAAFFVTGHGWASTELASTAMGQGLRTQVPSVGGIVSLAGDTASQSILQFKAGGHLLGFQPTRAYLVAMDHALRIEFLGTPGVIPKAVGEVEAEVEGSGAPALGKVVYPELWEGISLAYTTDQNGIAETIYEVSPRADVSRIRWRTNVPVVLQKDGSLRFEFDRGHMTESAPIAWQEVDGRRVPVDVAFRLSGDELGFRVGAYDPGRKLIIDPTYAWHTFYGSTALDYGRRVATDSGGNVYVTGYTQATWNGPGGQAPLHAFTGPQDSFVLKLNSSGAYQWHTFYGSGGFYGFAADTGGNAYLTGYSTATWNGPGGQAPLHAFTGPQDSFVLKLNSNGAYQWHTFYSGPAIASDVAMDTSDSIYVSGACAATWNGPGGEAPLHAFTPGTNQFVLKLTSSGAYQWHTFYGPVAFVGVSIGLGVDAGGNVYIPGFSVVTWNGPGGEAPLHAFTPGANQFVLKLTSSGAYQWHTFYLTGIVGSQPGFAADIGGNVYLAGSSGVTWNGPGGQAPLHAYTGPTDTFVLKLNNNGAYQWHTFYGTFPGSYNALAADARGNVYVNGMSTATWNGPDGQSPLHAYTGPQDPFVLKLNANGAYQWHDFYGSGTNYVFGASVDARGDLYITGASFTTWNGAEGQSPLHGWTGNYDMYLLKMRDAVPGDWNGDGMPDILWRNSATGADAVWYMEGVTYLGAAALPETTVPGWEIVANADLDNDGQLDILWRNNGTGENVVWYMDGVTFLSAAQLPTTTIPGWEVGGFADLNHDGQLDIIWRNSSSGATAVWYLNGATFVSAAQLPTVPNTSWKIAGIADLNNNGQADIIWRNSSTGANVVWYMNGAAFASAAQLPAVSDTSWEIGGIGYFSDDNYPDFLWRNSVTGANAVWYMEGATLQSGVPVPAVPLPAVTDLNWEIVGP